MCALGPCCLPALSPEAARGPAAGEVCREARPGERASVFARTQPLLTCAYDTQALQNVGCRDSNASKASRAAPYSSRRDSSRACLSWRVGGRAAHAGRQACRQLAPREGHPGMRLHAANAQTLTRTARVSLAALPADAAQQPCGWCAAGRHSLIHELRGAAGWWHGLRRALARGLLCRLHAAGAAPSASCQGHVGRLPACHRRP
jgi:hypothetical protein